MNWNITFGVEWNDLQEYFCSKSALFIFLTSWTLKQCYAFTLFHQPTLSTSIELLKGVSNGHLISIFLNNFKSLINVFLFISRQEPTGYYFFNDSIYSVDSPADNPHLFVASGEDGTVQIVDIRSQLGMIFMFALSALSLWFLHPCGYLEVSKLLERKRLRIIPWKKPFN